MIFTIESKDKLIKDSPNFRGHTSENNASTLLLIAKADPGTLIMHATIDAFKRVKPPDPTGVQNYPTNRKHINQGVSKFK